MRIRNAMLAVAGTFAIFAIACGGDGGSDDSSGRATGVAGVPDGSPLVDQDSLSFKPNSLTVETGEVVYFKNSESALHTVTINDENLSGSMNRNDIFQWTPASTGSYKVTCDFHPQMKATVEVVESLPDPTSADQG